MSDLQNIRVSTIHENFLDGIKGTLYCGFVGPADFFGEMIYKCHNRGRMEYMKDGRVGSMMCGAFISFPITLVTAPISIIMCPISALIYTVCRVKWPAYKDMTYKPPICTSTA
jgi:hypothetical protein